MSKGILLVGEPMGLFIAQTKGPLETVEGYSMAVAGAEFNVAVGLARLEHKVSYLTKLGNDPFGKLIVNVLNKNKIGNEFVSYSDTNSTGFMLKSRVDEGDPEIFYFRRNSAASTLSPNDLEHVDFHNYGMLHLTGIFPALSETTSKSVFALIKKAREHGLSISFDPNLRPQLWKEQKTMVDTINEIASLCDFILPGNSEGEILLGSSDPKDIGKFYLEKGAKAVFTKVGAKGCCVSTKEEHTSVAGFPVEKIVDTVGAGDGFAAGVISGIMEGMSYDEAARRGNAIGAIQVTSRGDNDGLPTCEELKKFMQV